MSRTISPKEVVAEDMLRAGRRPVNRTWLLDIVLAGTAAFLFVWCCFAFLVIPAAIGFAPVSLALIVVAPTTVVGGGLKLVALVRHCGGRINNSHGFAKNDDDGSKLDRSVQTMITEQGELALKIAMVLTFATVILLTWFIDHFYEEGGTEVRALRCLCLS